MSDTAGWVITAAAWLLWLALLEPPLPSWLTSTVGPVFDAVVDGVQTVLDVVVAAASWRPW